MASIPTSLHEGRRARLLELLPEYGWDIAKAGEKAGYGPTYAKKCLAHVIWKDVDFCRQMEAKSRELAAQTTDRREKRLHDLDGIIDDARTAPRDRIKAIEVQGKMCGWLSETRVLEVAERQRQLSESEQQEARWLAKERFKTCKTLPPDDIYVLQGGTDVHDSEVSGVGSPVPASIGDRFRTARGFSIRCLSLLAVREERGS
jgi:hypothetical protein